MKRFLFATALAAGTASMAFAQTDDMTNSAPMKLSQLECEALWNQASPDGAPISESQSAPYVTNFKAANPDGDGTIEKSEFSKACDDGLVKSSASTGAASGESGASNSPETLHAPTNRVGDQVPTMKSDENQPDQ
jgi:hypothetical protein